MPGSLWLNAGYMTCRLLQSFPTKIPCAKADTMSLPLPGGHLYTASYDHSLKAWDLERGDVVAT
eukprot:2589307-Prorocentrum_lima.AAC.1